MTGNSKGLHSGSYVEMYESKPISRVARLAKYMRLESNTRLIDFACGNGMLLEVVHNKVRHYTGVDFSSDFIASAKKRATRLKASNCTFACDDIIEFCSKNAGRYDVATALDFSEHVTDDEFIPIFSAIHQSLTPRGFLYLHTPNLNFFMERMRDSGILLKQRPEHVAVRNVEHNLDLLARCGFDRANMHAYVISHYNTLKWVHPLRHFPVVGKFFAARLFIECRA